MGQEWLDYLRQINWTDTLKVAGTSSVISSIVAIGWISAKEARARRRDRFDTALDVALSLEAYARTCRAMMHRADWASGEAARVRSVDAIKSVTVPVFLFPEKIHWKRLRHDTASELREFPAAVHAAREYLESFREYGDPIDLCDQVEFECAKAAKDALNLARSTRRKHGAAPWKPGAKDSDLERELSDFIASKEEKRRNWLERQKQSRADLAPERVD